MKRLIISCMVALMLVLACNDIFEIDISETNIVLEGPNDGDTIVANPMSFYWQLNQDISKYHIQVVQPNFSAPQYYRIDTIIDEISLTTSLGYGPYEWRVRGENGEVYSPYTKRSLFVDTTGTGYPIPINNLYIQIFGPVSGDTVKVNPMSFAWEEVVQVNEYHLQVARPSFKKLQLMAVDTVIEKGSININLLPGEYEWRVRGQNGLSTSPYVTTAFVMDSVVDIDQPVRLSSPSNAQVYTAKSDTNIVFRWDRIVGVDSYYLEIANESFGSGKSLHAEKIVAGTSQSISFPAQTYSKSYEWRVTGLATPYNTQTSSIRSFKLNVPATTVIVNP